MLYAKSDSCLRSMFRDRWSGISIEKQFSMNNPSHFEMKEKNNDLLFWRPMSKQIFDIISIGRNKEMIMNHSISCYFRSNDSTKWLL